MSMDAVRSFIDELSSELPALDSGKVSEEGLESFLVSTLQSHCSESFELSQLSRNELLLKYFEYVLIPTVESVLSELHKCQDSLCSTPATGTKPVLLSIHHMRVLYTTIECIWQLGISKTIKDCTPYKFDSLQSTVPNAIVVSGNVFKKFSTMLFSLPTQFQALHNNETNTDEAWEMIKKEIFFWKMVHCLEELCLIEHVQHLVLQRNYCRIFALYFYLQHMCDMHLSNEKESLSEYQSKFWNSLKQEIQTKLSSYLQGFSKDQQTSKHSIKLIVINIRVLLSLSRSVSLPNGEPNWLQTYASNYLTDILLCSYDQQGLYYILVGYLDNLSPTSHNFLPLVKQLCLLLLKIPISMNNRKDEYITLVLRQMTALFEYAKSTQDVVLMTSIMMLLTYFSTYYPKSTYEFVYRHVFAGLYAIFPVSIKLNTAVMDNNDGDTDAVIIKPSYLLANAFDIQKAVDSLYLFFTFLPSFATSPFYVMSTNEEIEQHQSTGKAKEIPNLGKLFHEVDQQRLITSIVIFLLQILSMLCPIPIDNSEESEKNMKNNSSCALLDIPSSSQNEKQKGFPSSLLIARESHSKQQTNLTGSKKLATKKRKEFEELQTHLLFIISKYLPLYVPAVPEIPGSELVGDSKAKILIDVFEEIISQYIAPQSDHKHSVVGEYCWNSMTESFEIHNIQYQQQETISTVISPSVNEELSIQRKRQQVYSVCQLFLHLYQYCYELKHGSSSSNEADKSFSATRTDDPLCKYILTLVSNVYIDALQSFLVTTSIAETPTTTNIHSNRWDKQDAAVLIDCFQEYLPFEWLLANRIQIFTLFLFILQHEIDKLLLSSYQDTIDDEEGSTMERKENEQELSDTTGNNGDSDLALHNTPTKKAPLIVDLSADVSKDHQMTPLVTNTKQDKKLNDDKEEKEDMVHYVLTLLSMILFYDPTSSSIPGVTEEDKTKIEENNVLKKFLPVLQQLLLLISNRETGDGMDHEEVIMSIMQQIIIRNTSAGKENKMFAIHNTVRSDNNDSNRLEKELARIEKEYFLQESAVLRAYGIRVLFHHICQGFPISAWYIGCITGSNNNNHHRSSIERIWQKIMMLSCHSLCDIDSYVYLTAILIIQRIYGMLVNGKESDAHDHHHPTTEYSEDHGNGMLLFFIRIYTNTIATTSNKSPNNAKAYCLDLLTVDAILSSIPTSQEPQEVKGSAVSNPRYLQSRYRLRMMISEILQQLTKKGMFFPSPKKTSAGAAVGVGPSKEDRSHTSYTVQSLQYLFLQCLQYSKFSLSTYLTRTNSNTSPSSSSNNKYTVGKNEFRSSNMTKAALDELLEHVNIFTGRHLSNAESNMSPTPTSAVTDNKTMTQNDAKEWTEEEHELLEQLYLRQSALSLLAELVILPLPYHISNPATAPTGPDNTVGSDIQSRLVDTFPSTEYLFDLLDICQGILLLESSYAVYDRTARRAAMFVIKHMIQYNHEYFFLLLPSQSIPSSSSSSEHPLIQPVSSSSSPPSLSSSDKQGTSSMTTTAQTTHHDPSLLAISSPISSHDQDKEGHPQRHRGYEYLKIILQTMRSKRMQEDADSVVIYQRESIVRYLQECTVHYLGLVKDSEDEKYDDLAFLRVVK